MNTRNMRFAPGLALVFLSSSVWVGGHQDDPGPSARRTDRDQDAMRGFHFFIGTWTPPGENPEAGFEFSWGIEEKTVHVRELRRIAGRLQPISDALVGWHYGEQELVFHEFLSDDAKEVMYTGRMWFEPGDVLAREFRAFDPDGTSRAYRERFVPNGMDAWTHHIDYQDDDGSWKPWGRFSGVRRPELGTSGETGK